MNFGLVTIAAFLLLLPGVGFITGVTFADKNVREIVFRNTPAEIGYVVLVSVVVHLVFAIHPNFNAAAIYIAYHENSQSTATIEVARKALLFSLSYFVATAIAGFLPGLWLGRLVGLQTVRWTRFFVKHRWMLNLVQVSRDVVIYARVVLKDDFAKNRKDSEKPIVVEGVLRDSYFASDGTLLYLVFQVFSEASVPASSEPCLDKVTADFKRPAEFDQFLVEGRNIAMVRFYAFRLPPVADLATTTNNEAG